MKAENPETVAQCPETIAPWFMFTNWFPGVRPVPPPDVVASSACA